MIASIPGSLAFFAIIWLMQVMAPGPNFVRISQAALTVSRRAAMVTASGTAAGNCSWCIAAALGAAVLMRNAAVSQALHLGGTVYFGWLGTMQLIGAFRRNPLTGQAPPLDESGFKAFKRGFATATANPQAVVFFATIFSTMFPQLSGGLLVTMVMIVATVNLGWYACVATVLTAGPARRIFERWQPVIDFTFGILLWAAALKLALAALA